MSPASRPTTPARAPEERAPGGSTPAPLRPRRSPRLVAAGLLLACLGGLGGAMAFQQASQANQVVLVQRTVMRGEVVGQSDLAVVTIGTAPGVDTVAASDLPSLVGQRALVDLPAGSLVGQQSVGATALPPGSAQLGLKLAAGRIPNGPLPAGTPLSLVQVSSDKAPAADPVLIDATTLSSPEKLPDGASRTLDVAVPEQEAQRVADLAARDLLVVVRRAEG